MLVPSSNPPDPSAPEQQLRQLLAAVLIAPVQSKERAKAMSRLLQVVRQLPGIKWVAHQDYLSALNLTWDWMSRHIDEFKPSTDSLENDLVRWINGHLHWRIHDIYHPGSNRPETFSLNEEFLDQGGTYLDSLSEQGFVSRSLSNLDAHIESLQRQEQQVIAIQIEEWIAQDPEQLLQSCHPRNYHQCHCRELAYKILVKDPPDSFAHIAREMNIPYQTMVSHWNRRCLPLIQKQATKFGYEP